MFRGESNMIAQNRCNIKQEHGSETRDTPTVGDIVIKKEQGSACFDCGLDITERFLLKVGLDQVWHPQCLRCSHCHLKLQGYSSCYTRDQNVYCRRCYTSQFSRSCSACRRPIGPTDWVRRARGYVYHLACFACDKCKRQLSTGEEFAMVGHRIRCRIHLYCVDEPEKEPEQLPPDDDSSTSSDDTLTSSGLSPKPKRIRTTFTEKQLDILNAHFKLDVNPDSTGLHSIANLTGLTKRVTQVWFQNSRARQKKYCTTRKVKPLSRSYLHSNENIFMHTCQR